MEPGKEVPCKKCSTRARKRRVMKTYCVSTIASAWKEACQHHLEFSSEVMDSGISKAGPCTFEIKLPEQRVPSKSTNPFMVFWTSVLGMTAEDGETSVIKKYLPELHEFVDSRGKFSLALGNRLRSSHGHDQEALILGTLRLGMQVLPAGIFDAKEDPSLQHRPSILCVTFSILKSALQVSVFADSLLIHETPFHSEMAVVSMWQEMLAIQMGLPTGPMYLTCAATAAMQAEHESLKERTACPFLQNLSLDSDGSTPELLSSEFKTWPLVGAAGKGYRTEFFRHTVIPMANVTSAIHDKDLAFLARRDKALEAATRIRDAGWRSHVSSWVERHLQEVQA